MYTTSGDSEAAYLESQAEYDEEYLIEMGLVPDPDENAVERLTDRIGLLRNRYDAAKVAKRGSTISCPTCGKQHIKTSYQKVFCSNGSHGKGNCKDRYWNFVDDNRRHRMMVMSGAVQQDSALVDAMMSNIQPKHGFDIEDLIKRIRTQPEYILKVIDRIVSQ